LFTSPTISRLSAVLLLITAILAIYVFLVAPIISGYGETDRQMAEARDQLAHFERAAAMRPVLAKRIKDFEEQRTSRGNFLTGGTDALAAAGLQDQVQALIIAKGGTLQSIQPMPGVQDQGLTRITLRVQMAGTIETLLDVLYALESGSPILSIDRIDIQGSEGVNGGSDAEAGAARLTVAADLSGYLPEEPQQ
jgi:Tfp pilus assembly protein PilO